MRGTTKDLQGRPYAKLSELKAGDTVIADAGFTCLRPGVKLTVRKSGNGRLYVPCKDGRHGLIGQADDGEHLIGLYRPNGRKGPMGPVFTAMERAALKAEEKYNGWLVAMMGRHVNPEKEAPALAEFQKAMSELSCARMQAKG